MALGATTPTPEAGRTAALPGARGALAMLLTINLINFVDRYLLSAVVTNIRSEFFPEGGTPDQAGTGFIRWLESAFGFDPKNALIGTLAMAFMVSYMITAPIFGWLADRMSRWVLIGIGVVLWSLASGASGLAGGFAILLLTRCFVGVGQAAYAPIGPAMTPDFYPL